MCLDLVCSMLAEKVQFSGQFMLLKEFAIFHWICRYIIGIMQQKILLIIWQIWIIFSIFNWNISVNDEWCLCQQWFCLLNELFLIEYQQLFQIKSNKTWTKPSKYNDENRNNKSFNRFPINEIQRMSIIQIKIHSILTVVNPTLLFCREAKKRVGIMNKYYSLLLFTHRFASLSRFSNFFSWTMVLFSWVI